MTSNDLFHPEDDAVNHTCVANGLGQVALNFSARLDDVGVTVIGMDLTRLQAVGLAWELVREACRR